MRRACLLLLALLSVLLSACGKPGEASSLKPLPLVADGPWRGLPQGLPERMARGVNAGSWFSHRGDPRLADGWPDAADFALMQRLGLRHVRVILDPVWLNDAAGNTQVLVEGLQRITQSGLAVVLALQPPAETKRQMATSDEPVQQAAALWRHLASVLKGIPADQLVFEVLNEPEMEDVPRALQVQRQLVEALREVTPARVAVIGGAHFSDVGDLAALQPLDLPGLIYSFHFYEPHNFTHQGASWGWPMWMVLRGLPYPSSPAALAPLLPTLTPLARPHARYYGEQGWKRESLATLLDQAAAWQRQHQKPVWCSEFGVLRDVAPAASRRAWLRDTRELLEARELAWTHFDWWGHFGLVTGAPGARSIDEDVRDGLGLQAP